MKKRVILSLTLALMTSISHAGFVTWSGGNYGASVKGVTLAEDWLVVLYKDAGKDNAGEWFNELILLQDGSVGSSSGVTANDEVIDVLTHYAALAKPIPTFDLYNFSKAVSVEDSVDIYTVLFNSSTLGGATSFIVAEPTPVDSGVGGVGTPVNYNLGTTFSGNWQAVPEPAVASLIAIFGGGLLVSRRIFSKG